MEGIAGVSDDSELFGLAQQHALECAQQGNLLENRSKDFKEMCQDTFDLKKAREILDRDHYGLADIKDRIREFIAVGVLRGSMQGFV